MRVCMSLLVAAALLGLAAPAQAQDKPVLDIYTYDSFASEWGPGPGIKAGFEKICACTVNFTTGEDAISTLRKVQLEGATTKADVVLGLDTATAPEARATGLFLPHQTDTNGLVLAWSDPDFVPFDYGYFAFVYDSTKVPNPPKSFEELAAMPAGFRIIIEDPRSSTPGLGLVHWIVAAYGDRAPEIWKGLKPHVVSMPRGWSEAYGLFLKGEADMVLSYTTSPAYHAVAENNPNYAYADFTEGFFPQTEVAGIVQSTDQLELSRQFLAYLISPEAQAIIPTTNWMYPVRDIGSALPVGFGAPPAKVLSLSDETIAAQSKAWVDAALAALQ